MGMHAWLCLSLLLAEYLMSERVGASTGRVGQTRELLHVLLPPHQRVCVKGHLLHSRVGI
jgi:hypothetical protein